jgi:hypothetical protein
MKRWALLLFTFAVPLSSPLACGGDGCLRNTDCSSDHVCRAGKCALADPPPVAAGGEGGEESNPNAGTAGTAGIAGAAGSGGMGGNAGSAGSETMAGQPSDGGKPSGGEAGDEGGAGGEGNAGAPSGGIGGAL